MGMGKKKRENCARRRSPSDTSHALFPFFPFSPPFFFFHPFGQKKKKVFFLRCPAKKKKKKQRRKKSKKKNIKKTHGAVSLKKKKTVSGLSSSFSFKPQSIKKKKAEK